jgi:ABC-2 type transport system permease protein
MKRAIAAEWGKIWSLRSPWFCVVAAVLLTVAIAMSLANDFVYDITQHHRPPTDTMPVLDALGPAVQLGQLALVALAMLVVTSEYGTGVIRATFLARPRRTDVLLAKTAVSAAVGGAAGLVAAATGWWAAKAALGTHEAAAPPISGCLRIALTVALACAFTTAVGFLLRSGAGTLTTAFVMLVGLQVLDERVSAYTPAGAATNFMSGDTWPALGILLAWVLAAQAAAWILLTSRDT